MPSVETTLVSTNMLFDWSHDFCINYESSENCEKGRVCTFFHFVLFHFILFLFYKDLKHMPSNCIPGISRTTILVSTGLANLGIAVTRDINK